MQAWAAIEFGGNGVKMRTARRYAVATKQCLSNVEDRRAIR
ncbi:hypothetical protein NONI108955_20645 [Nocardia ninae]